MKNKKSNKMILFFIPLFLLSIISLSIVSAIEIENTNDLQTLGTFQRDTCVMLVTSCANCTFVNITSIAAPNSNNLLREVVMTKQGTEYNYSFCKNSQLGQYIVRQKADPNGVLVAPPFDYYITTTGNSKGDSLPLFLFLGATMLLIIALFSRNLYFSFISGALFIVGGIYMMIYGLETVADVYTRAIAFVTLGFGLILLIGSSYDMLTAYDNVKEESEED